MHFRASVVVVALAVLPPDASAQFRQPIVFPVSRWTDSASFTASVRAPGASHRYPAVGSALGFVLPGLGHVYSTEYRRGSLVFAVTMTGAFFALSDGSPQAAAAAGSVFYVGGWLFSIVDGAFAADRYNRRRSTNAIVQNR